MSLWFGIALLLLAAGLFVAFPFFTGRRAPEESANTTEQANVDIFRDQQYQYQQQLERGEISAQQHQQMLAEAEQLLLANTARIQQRVAAREGLWLLPVLVVVIALASVMIYRGIGAGPDQQIAEALREQQSWTADLKASIAQRAEQRPDNIYYWTILAENAVASGDMSGAADYFAEGIRIQPNESYLLGQYAQALFFVDANLFSDRVLAAMDRAYAVDPSNQTVLGLKGIHAFQEADYPRAISYWQAAARGLNPASDGWQALQKGIQQARQLGGPELTVADGPRIAVSLSIDPAIQFSPDQLVFIAVIEANGPPMPLAARKLSAAQLPTELVLSDSDALIAGRKLGDVSSVVVVARLSSSGSATPQQGDWQAISEPADISSGSVNLTLKIDTEFRQ